MVLLSSYSNGEIPPNQDYLDPEPTLFQQNQADFVGYNSLEYLTDYNSSSFLDPCYEVQDMTFPVYSDYLLPYFPSPEPLIPDTLPFPCEDVAPWLCPKRQRMCQQEYCHPASFYPLPELQNSASSQAVSGMVNVENGRNLSERSVSLQSIAARERRRKITEKTQELSKLIPGGTKMNTAEMLQAASEYVKFMQAQIGILQCMSLLKENKKEGHFQGMEIVASSIIQGKLSSDEKCLIPKDLVLALKERSKTPPVSQELNKLLA